MRTMAPSKRTGRGHRGALDLAAILTGVRVDVGDAQYHVERLLTQHPDRSFAFLATDLGSRREVVLRTFDREFRAIDKLASRSVPLRGHKGVAAYERYGTFELTHVGLKPLKDESLRLHCLVRQYEARTLRAIESSKGISSREAMSILNDIAHGIRELHEHNISIESLRPANILIGRYGAKIADYGLGFLDGLDVAEPDTRFKAPEQLAPGSSRTKTRQATKAADLWAFGKLARYVDSRVTDEVHYDRPLLYGVIARCFNTDPIRRPEIDVVLRDLFQETVFLNDMRPSRPRFQQLVSAAVIDIDARALSGLKWDLDYLDAFGSSAAAELDELVDTRRGYRLRELPLSEGIHFLSSFMMARGRFVKTPKTDKIMVPMEGAFSPDWIKAPLDPLWEDSLRPPNHRVVDEEERDVIEGLRAVMIDEDIDTLLGQRPNSADFYQHVFSEALAARNEILQRNRFVRSEQVAASMASTCPGITADEVRILRDLGYLLAVPLADNSLYPSFQFDPDTGLPFDAIKVVNDRFYSPEASTWGILGWWTRANRYLGSESPASYMARGGDDSVVADVLRAADAA